MVVRIGMGRKAPFRSQWSGYWQQRQRGGPQGVVQDIPRYPIASAVSAQRRNATLLIAFYALPSSAEGKNALRLQGSRRATLFLHPPFHIPSAVPLASLLCLVVAISDGDTLTARCGAPGAYQQLKVRIAAIDAPESRQAFGQKSRQNLARLCFRQHATLQPVEQDSYGRTVAHVRCSGTDVAAAQVRSGLAWVYTPYAESRPQLVALQRQARSSATGLWSQKRPLAPWTYRHRRSQR